MSIAAYLSRCFLIADGKRFLIEVWSSLVVIIFYLTAKKAFCLLVSSQPDLYILSSSLVIYILWGFVMTQIKWSSYLES